MQTHAAVTAIVHTTCKPSHISPELSVVGERSVKGVSVGVFLLNINNTAQLPVVVTSTFYAYSSLLFLPLWLLLLLLHPAGLDLLQGSKSFSVIGKHVLAEL